MLDHIKAAFPQIIANDCCKSTDSTLCWVFDADEDDEPLKRRCYLHADPLGKQHFTIENPTARTVHFIAIDNCVFPHSESVRRCGFAVFDSKTFCFVELKEVHIAARRSEQLNKAKEQLLTTIKHFQERVEFSTKRIEAYACVGRTAVRPARSATNLDELAAFREVGVKLYFGSIKRFA